MAKASFNHWNGIVRVATPPQSIAGARDSKVVRLNIHTVRSVFDSTLGAPRQKPTLWSMAAFGRQAELLDGARLRVGDELLVSASLDLYETVDESGNTVERPQFHLRRLFRVLEADESGPHPDEHPFNIFMAIGTVGKDPVLQTTGSGTPMVRVPIVTTKTWVDPSGQKQERSIWTDAILFERSAQTFVQIVKKRDLVQVYGDIELASFVDREGRSRQKPEVYCQHFVRITSDRFQDVNHRDASVSDILPNSRETLQQGA